MTSTQPDAVIIGAGHNSLACALHLLARGWSVQVLEQAATPGGAIKTQELTLPGFRHDWAAMNLSLFAGSPFFQAYSDELLTHGLDFVTVQNPFASVFPDRGWFGVSQDTAQNLQRVRDLSQADAETWRKLTDGFPDLAAQVLRVLGSPMNLHSLARIGLGSLRSSGIAGSLDLLQFFQSSPRRWLDETFDSDRIKTTLAAWGMHLDFAPDIAGGAVFPYLEAMAAQAFGMVLGRGGADTVISALCRAIKARGGHIIYNAPVTRILRDGNLATGVELADGRRISAGRAVIANVAPAALSRMIGQTEPRYDRALQRFRHAPGTMMIHLAMSDLPDWAAGPELRQFAYVHLAPSMNQMARTYQQANAGLLPDEPVIVCGQPTAIDPDRAPDGQHILWLQVRMAPARIMGDAAGEIPARTWPEAREAFANRALDILERYAPGTKEKILARHVVSPLDLEAENPNLVGGDQLCGSHHLSQNFLFRPARGHADGTTPIRRLFHTGAAVWPGAGTGAGAGYQLARKLAGK